MTFVQALFLTAQCFIQNRLIAFAASCSFSFLFSVIPIFMMIVMVLVRIMHASPSTVAALLSTFPELGQYLNSEHIIHSVQSIETVSALEIVVGIFIFWMARRFFASVFDSLQHIFHTRTKRKAFINQILTFVVEFVTVLVASAVIFACISLQTVSSLPFFRSIPQLDFLFAGIVSADFIIFLPNILIFVVISVLYRSVPGTKPSVFLCMFSSALCTFCFWIFRMILHFFLNVGRYNLIYGVFGHVVILFMDIFFFFTFFLTFAQCIYVVQFLDWLLLGELYLLPGNGGNKIGARVKRLLFIRPDFLIAKNARNVISCAGGDVIFTEEDTTTDAFYIISGSVLFTVDGKNSGLIHRGDFFGETSCILSKKRGCTATAAVPTRIIRIDGETFRFLVKNNPDVARKTLSQISPFFE